MNNCRIICTLFLFPLLMTQAQAQWQALGQLTSFDEAAIFQIDYLEDDYVLASYVPIPYSITKPRVLLRSSDLGQSWNEIPIGLADTAFVNDPFMNVFGFSAINRHIFYVNLLNLEKGQGVLAKTTNGGGTWTSLEIPFSEPGEAVDALHFFDQDTGIVTSAVLEDPENAIYGPVRFYRTTDGGASWTSIPSPASARTGYWLSYETYTESFGDTLWIGSIDGIIFRSTDKGASFEAIDLGVGPDNNASVIEFKNAQDGIVVVHQTGLPFPAKAFRTVDGGDTWNRIKIPERLETLNYVPGSDGVWLGAKGYYIGYTDYYISTDDAQTWTRVDNTENANLRNFVFKNPSVGLSGGYHFDDNNLMYAYQGPPLMANSISTPEKSFDEQGVDILPEGYILFDIQVLSENLLWGVAFDDSITNQISEEHIPLVVKSTDGGQSWEVHEVTEAPGRISFDLFAFDEMKAMITTQDFNSGAGRGVFLTTDGGQSWTEKFRDVSGGVWIHFFDEMDGVIINARFVALTDDGGSTWTRVEGVPAFLEGEFTLIDNATNSLAAAGSTVWFGTTQDRIFKSHDRGRTWRAIEVSPTAQLNIQSLSFKDGANGLALSFGGFGVLNAILGTNDGGNSWELRNRDFYINNISYVPGTENTYIGTGQRFDQVVVLTHDGGMTWEAFPDVQAFGAVQFISPDKGWIARAYGNFDLTGMIYRYNGPALGMATGLEDLDGPVADQVRLGPNPAQDQVQVFIRDEKYVPTDLFITTVDGQVLRRIQPDGKTITLSLADLPSGMYFITGKNKLTSFTRKLIKN